MLGLGSLELKLYFYFQIYRAVIGSVCKIKKYIFVFRL